MSKMKTLIVAVHLILLFQFQQWHGEEFTHCSSSQTRKTICLFTQKCHFILLLDLFIQNYLQHYVCRQRSLLLHVEGHANY